MGDVVTRKLAFSLGLASLLLVGCGGSGGSNAVTAQHASLDAAKAAYAFRHLNALGVLHYRVLESLPTAEKIYDPNLDVDYRIIENGEGAFRIPLTEPGSDQSVGELRLSTVDGPPDPIQYRQIVNATTHGSHLLGGFDIIFDDTGATTRFTGRYDVTHPRSTVYFDMGSTTAGPFGSFGARVDDSDAVDFRDFTYSGKPEEGPIATHANFTTREREGTVTMRTDGSGEATATDGTGTYTIRWTTDWNITLVRPDGSSTVLGPIDAL